MEKIINFKSLFDYKYLTLLAMVVINLFGSCKKEHEIELIIHTRISFESDFYTIEKDATEGASITLHLTRPLEDKGSVVIKIDEDSSADDSEYAINPEPVSGLITLALQKGDSTASFMVNSNHNFAEDKTLSLTIEETTGALLPSMNNSNANTLVTLKGNRIPPELITSVSDLEDFGEVNNGSESPSQSYMLIGTSITEDVKVSASENFKISLDDVTFENALQIRAADINHGPVTIYVKFVPSTGMDDAIYGSIASSSEEAINVITVSGIETGNEEIPDPPYFVEDFEYGNIQADLADVTTGAGVVLSEGISDWIMTNSGGSATRMMQYLPEGLPLAGYPSLGGSASLSNGNNVNLSKYFTPQSSGVIYTSIAINISAASASTFFFSHMEGTGTHNRLYAMSEGGDLKLGIARGTSAVYSAMSFNFNTNYIVVIKYDFSTQESSMYVLDSSTPTLTEPVVPNAISRTSTLPGAFEGLQLRQSSGVLEATFDRIRVANSWKGALGL